MTIRCGECHGIFWVQPIHEESRSAQVACGSCGKQYVLEAWSKLKGAGRSLSERARKVAKERGIDLPGAYSLLLGILQEEQLAELGDPGSTPCRTASAPASRSGSPNDSCAYDPEFQPAIDKGCLTPRQAAERGRRDAFAGILASRHDLRRSVALAVADNRMSLLQAIRERQHRRAEEPVRLAVHDRRPLRIAALVGSLIAVLGLAYVLRDGPASQPAGLGTELTIGSAQVRKDAADRVTQVNAPSPQGVLRAYCVGDTRRGRLEALAVVPSSTQGAQARIGLLRDPHRPEKMLSILIREDRAASRWIAGDGRSPLIAEPAPVGAEQAVHRR